MDKALALFFFSLSQGGIFSSEEIKSLSETKNIFFYYSIEATDSILSLQGLS